MTENCPINGECPPDCSRTSYDCPNNPMVQIRRFRELLISAKDRCGVAKSRDFNKGYELGITEGIRQAIGVLYSHLPDTSEFEDLMKQYER